MVDILVDSREPLGIKSNLSTRFPGAQVASLGLWSGDLLAILPNGAMVIERKDTPNDLLRSLRDGELFNQSLTIPRFARFPFLLLDGDLKYSTNDKVMVSRNGFSWQESEWNKSSVEMALFKVQAMGMLLVREDDAIIAGCQTYADKVARLIDWCQTADAVHVSRRSCIANPFESDQAELDFLAALPRIKEGRAAGLLKNYSAIPLYQILLHVLNDELDRKQLPGRWTRNNVQQIRDFLQMPANVKLKQETLENAHKKETD